MIQFLPLNESLLDAAKAFNTRISANGNAPFLLPEQPVAHSESGVLHAVHYVAVDGSDVRGGYLLTDYPAVLKGQPVTASNIQSPLSESISDNRFAMLPLRMVKQFLSHNRLCFAVGMGDQSNAFPRLLKASGWSLESVPFYFRIHRMAQFLTGMPVLQNPWWKRAGAMAAAYSGSGAIAGMVLQRRKIQPEKGASVSRESEWNTWADAVWECFATKPQFAVRRNVEVLRELYPIADSRLRIHRVSIGSQTIGWSASFVKRMEGSPYFGNLLVASILDCAALPGHFSTVAALADQALGAEGVDLVITNQSLSDWKQAFHSAGFRQGPSNFQLGLSPEFAKTLSKTPVASGLIHVVRGDGDGRLNL